MGIYKRPDSLYWWLSLDTPAGRRRLATKILVQASTPQQTKENRRLAEVEYHQRMSDLAKLRLDLPDARAGVTLDQHAAWYLAHVAPRHKGHAREAVIVAHLRRRLGALDLRAIDRATAQEYIAARLADGVQPQTVNREITVLKTLLREAIPRYLRANPLAGMKRLAARTTRKRVVFEDEEARLLAGLHGETRDLYIVAVDTLLRQGNVVHLHRREVRRDHLALEDSKTGPFTVPLSDRARAILRTRLAHNPTWIFPGWHERFLTSQPQASVELNRELRRAAKAAGIPVDGREGRFSWHGATRATGATRMLRAGVDPRQVQAVGNWRSFDQMAGYLELQTGAGHDAVNRIAVTSASRQSGESS